MTKASAEADINADVRLLLDGFDPAPELAAFTASRPRAGGIVSFLGQVRSGAGEAGEVEALELKHYEPLTLPEMRKLAAEALRRWELDGLLIVHRAGLMHPGDPIVLVAAAARHRRDAFAAADFAMDHLKSESWFWKREKVAGEWRWVEPREADFEDLRRWAQG
jgi:molybdopterin synthase catalytic subunit